MFIAFYSLLKFTCNRFSVVDDDSVSQVILTQFCSLESIKHIYLWFQREISTREIFFQIVNIFQMVIGTTEIY